MWMKNYNIYHINLSLKDGCTHWEFWELRIQLEIYNLGNVLFILNGSSIKCLSLEPTFFSHSLSSLSVELILNTKFHKTGGIWLISSNELNLWMSGKHVSDVYRKYTS
jgi:hypothetical protein